MSADSVVLEIFFVRFPSGEDQTAAALWAEIDEQPFPLDMRRRLAANGFRAGLVGGRLPTALAELLAVQEEPRRTEDGLDLVDLEKEPAVRRRRLQIRAGQPARIIATGEHSRHPQLTVLVRGDDGEVTGRTFPKATGLFTAQTFPQGDGRVRLELVPEVEHGEPERRFVPGDGRFKIEIGPPREVFDALRLQAALAPGQTLVLAGLGELPGSLGHHYFHEESSGRREQKLLLIRLAQTQGDDLFPPAAPVNPG